MTHLLLMIVLIIFNKYVIFCFFSFAVFLGQFLPLSLSAGGVLSVSFQIGVSIVYLVLEALRYTKDKKREIYEKTLIWYEYLAIGIVLLIWVFIVVNDFQQHREMSLHEATIQMNEKREYGGLFLRAGAAISFAYVTNYCVTRLLRKIHDLLNR